MRAGQLFGEIGKALKQKFTVMVLINVVAINIFNSLIRNLVNPIIHGTIDNENNISSYSIDFRSKTVNVGRLFLDILTSVIFLIIVDRLL
tara:strand:+ start:214 stop:483 length:270 start_codon:yes stop_codon:yes gene_type:complete